MQLCCVISEPQLSVEIEQIKNMHVFKSSDGCLIRDWLSSPAKKWLSNKKLIAKDI